MKTIAIMGGGFTGLVLANELKERYNIILVEKEKELGGVCRSFNWNGIPLDYGPHKIFSSIPLIMERFNNLCLGMYTHKKKNSIFLKGKNFAFPLKITQFALKMNPFTTLKLGLSFLKAQLKKYPKPETYEDYVKQGFGEYGYNLIFKDYAPKLWGDPKELSEEIARRRIPLPDLKGLLGLSKEAKKKVSAEKFLYPREGIGEVCNILEENIKPSVKILSNTIIKRIIIKDNEIRRIVLENETIDINFVVSTIPLKDLVKYLNPNKIIINETKKLKYKHLFVFYILLSRNKVMDDHWRFFPEKNVCFNRIAEYKNFNPDAFPEGRTIISAEVTFDDKQEFPITGERIIDDLEKIKLIRKEEIIDTLGKNIYNIYPIYDLYYKERLKIIYAYLDKIKNLITIGRAGCFNYNNMDHCMDMALTAKEFVCSGKNKKLWFEMRKRFEDYKIID